ncbi:MAG: hypothetical protein K2H40_07385 [Lachnospiraceae bacterium]|nr:hypothetical protein [Lachnospiraceae bacterium]
MTLVRTIHAGMPEIAAGAGNAADATEIVIATMITIIMVMTVMEWIPDLNRDSMQDRLVAGRPAAVKRRTTDCQNRNKQWIFRSMGYSYVEQVSGYSFRKGYPDTLLDERKSQ